MNTTTQTAATIKVGSIIKTNVPMRIGPNARETWAEGVVTSVGESGVSAKIIKCPDAPKWIDGFLSLPIRYLGSDWKVVRS